MTADTSIALNRFGLGARPDEAPPPQARQWVQEQLGPAPTPAPASQPDSAALVQALAQQAEQLRQTPDPGEKMLLRETQRKAARQRYDDAVQARLLQALTTPTPVLERLVHFWANHFALSVEKPEVLALAGAFEAEAIRPHVLGRFEDMLLAVGGEGAGLRITLERDDGTLLASLPHDETRIGTRLSNQGAGALRVRSRPKAAPFQPTTP